MRSFMIPLDGKCSARGVRGDQRSSVLGWADVREKCTSSALLLFSAPFSRAGSWAEFPRQALMGSKTYKTH